MNQMQKGIKVTAYTVMIKTLRDRISKTPVDHIKDLSKDFTHLYRTEMKLAKLSGVTVSDK